MAVPEDIAPFSKDGGGSHSMLSCNGRVHIVQVCGSNSFGYRARGGLAFTGEGQGRGARGWVGVGGLRAWQGDD